MIRFVRAVIYILVLAAIGWFASKIYIDPKFQTAMGPAAETTPARTVAAPPIPFAKPARSVGDTVTAAAVETAPELADAAPPTPVAKPEPLTDDTTTAPAEDTTPAPTEAAPPATLADAGDYVERRNGETIVDVPTTRVETGGDKRTRVKVRAPYTKVDVDTKRRRVRIRVPYYNGDIRW
jgi:hypothetical protein